MQMFEPSISVRIPSKGTADKPLMDTVFSMARAIPFGGGDHLDQFNNTIS
jgi:hypothetical protein